VEGAPGGAWDVQEEQEVGLAALDVAAQVKFENNS